MSSSRTRAWWMFVALVVAVGLVWPGVSPGPAWAKKPIPPWSSITIPVWGGPQRGPDAAPVTIVAFADYQCPFCARAEKTLAGLRAKYGADVRVVFKHYPLPFHHQAEAAARAAQAAGAQGKFWEMHDAIFANQRDLKARARDIDVYLVELAKKAGVPDLKKFEVALTKNAQVYDSVVARDKALGTRLGVRGTPNFFINGLRLTGAQPKAAFEKIIDQELAATKDALAAGVIPELLYAERVKVNFEPPKSARTREKREVEFVPVGPEDAVIGSADALVTVVVFSEFQCPFCKRAHARLAELRERYGEDVRVVFKHLPLPFHKQAEQAAVAALAAGRQGKFWEMHDALFARQKQLRDGPEFLVQLADEQGLDLIRFEADLEDPHLLEQVRADKALAASVGAKGTPTFFINGVRLVGAQPLIKFTVEVDRQLGVARALAGERGLSGDALYRAAVESNRARR